MTTFSSRDGKGQDLSMPERSESFENGLQTVGMRLIHGHEDLTHACHDGRALRREKQRGRRRELRAKASARVVTLSSLALAVTGSVAFAVAVVLLVAGASSTAMDVLTFAGVAWGGAAAIRACRR
ncbi:hypothetical protein RVN83_36365 [Streptomyces sp. PU10]|uniref:Integral membrane protein n=1 Tax=Streptomyces salinarius TaxID=2762598 RepID=A0ABW8BLU2_9ACTN|nr:MULTISPECIES: hypothetical protein [unclassified Streptomyces]MDU0258403.1 hypothetical protein [Streptomyces sp. PU10]QKW65973.1 hypothetical protein HUT15_36135 [Streptomyces sp. NA03103]